MAKKFNRKAAQEYMLGFIQRFDKTGRNHANLKAIYDAMSDDQFHEMMLAIKEKKANTPFIYDHLTDNRIDLAFVDGFASKEFGLKLRQRIRYKSKITDEYYWSNSERWILDVPIRRLIQSIENKISVSTSKQVNVATNQPVGDNKSSSISGPESLILLGQGFDAAVSEFLVVRGGDMQAKNALDQSIRQSGGASLNAVLAYGEGAKAVATVGHQFTAAHWRNNLKE